MPARTRADAERARRGTRLDVRLTYALWALLLFDLPYFLAIRGTPVLGLIANFVFVPILALCVLRGVTARTRSWMWYPPFLLLLLACLGSVPALTNRFMGWSGTQGLITYYTLAVATGLFIRSGRDAMPIIAMMGFRFLWWAVWGRANGNVIWDPLTANPDDFGALMVQGVAICFWMGIATRSRWQRALMLGLTLYCILGVVTSLARGAFLALVVVALVAWLRSPRKALTASGLLIGAVVVMLAASVLVDSESSQISRGYRSGTFKEQILSVFDEGTESGTGAHRKSLWTAAFKVWKQHPLFGVGANNFGVFAAEHFRPGEIEGFENTATFWQLNVHSAYFQVLSEFGLVGIIGLGWLIVDFFKKNRALRRPGALARWAALGMSGKFELRSLSFAMEGGFIALTLVNAIYSTFNQPWLVATWAANTMLWSLTSAEAQAKPDMKPAQRGRSKAAHAMISS